MRFLLISLPFFLFLFSCDDNINLVEKEVAEPNKNALSVEASTSLEDLFSINLINNSCGIGLQMSDDKAACEVEYSCSSDFECINVGNIFADELFSLFELSNLKEINFDIEAEEKPLFDFKVHGNTILSDNNPSAFSLDNVTRFWDDFNWIVPLEYRDDIKKFHVYDGGWMQSYMLMHDMVNADEWTFAVNRLGFVSAESAAKTYVHEFSHLLSLRSTQVDYYSDFVTCDSLFVEGLCFREDSYLYDFFMRFHDGTSYPDNDLFFVSSYAYTNPLEDFAESFLHFIFEPSLVAETIRDEKVLFFYDYPEFIHMRNQILARTIAWLPESDYFVYSDEYSEEF